MDSEDKSIESFYYDVYIHTDFKIIKAYKLPLATRSPWFHKYFQSRENMQICDIAFFNTPSLIVETAIDILYGKEIVIPVRYKSRLTHVLEKLEVKWTDGDMPEETDRYLFPPPSTSSSKAELSPKSMIVQENPSKHFKIPGTSSQSVHEKFERVETPEQVETLEVETHEAPEAKKAKLDTANEEDFYAILDKFTETSEAELNRICHIRIGEDGQPDRRYQCLKCERKSKYATQAQEHYREHENVEFSSVRETLRKSELDRLNEVNNISKIEKGIGKVPKKEIMTTLRRVNENLQKHLETLDALEKSKLPDKLGKKCKEYSTKLLGTTLKVDQVIEKLETFSKK